MDDTQARLEQLEQRVADLEKRDERSQANWPPMPYADRPLPQPDPANKAEDLTPGYMPPE